MMSKILWLFSSSCRELKIFLTCDSARLKQMRGNLPVQRSYTLWVSSLMRPETHWDDLPAERVYLPWVSSELFYHSIKNLLALLSLHLFTYLILPGRRTRTQDPLNGGDERAITQTGLKHIPCSPSCG